MNYEVIGTDEFKHWFECLDEGDMDAVAFCVDLLEERGVSLGYPHSSALKGTDYPLRELRVQSKGKPLRVIYPFDPKRQAVLILGGDKTGNPKFYDEHIPIAEKIWREYLAETR